MQRQSLGSPSSKVVKDEQQQLPSQSPSSPPINLTGGLLYGAECREEEELKKLKPKTATPQSYIHLIPILTLLCILILYLSSHDPALKDLADLNGAAKSISNYADSDENSISELQRILAIEKGDILAIRSLKNLKQDAAKQRRLHRKIAHF